MDLSVEISLYPLQDEFIPAIDAFIAQLEECTDVDVFTNSMSTQLFGEYKNVMALLSIAMEESFSRFGTLVFVTKLIGTDTRQIISVQE